MLTGRPPFQAATPVDTLLLVLDQDPVRPRLLNPKVDPDLELICLKCLQKEPTCATPSAAGLAADLEAFLDGEAAVGPVKRLARCGRPVQPGLSRDAPRRRAGELGPAVDVAQRATCSCCAC